MFPRRVQNTLFPRFVSALQPSPTSSRSPPPPSLSVCSVCDRGQGITYGDSDSVVDKICRRELEQSSWDDSFRYAPALTSHFNNGLTSPVCVPPVRPSGPLSVCLSVCVGQQPVDAGGVLQTACKGTVAVPPGLLMALFLRNGRHLALSLSLSLSVCVSSSMSPNTTFWVRVGFAGCLACCSARCNAESGTKQGKGEEKAAWSDYRSCLLCLSRSACTGMSVAAGRAGSMPGTDVRHAPGRTCSAQH